MTEQEWLECADPTPMLRLGEGNMSERKLRLFAVACCRRIWDRLPDLASQCTVLDAEEAADGHVKAEKLARHRASLAEIAQASALSDARTAAWWTAWQAPDDDAEEAAFSVVHLAASAYLPDSAAKSLTEPKAQANHLRDIVGNPFRPVTINPAWLTSTVTDLAQAIYTDRAFDRMPILADALEDAGCDNADMLNHCRQPGDHVRGCWALDLMLGMK